MAIEMTCPTCGSHDISKNGTTRRGKQNYKCRDCGRQFVEDPQWKPKDKDTFSLVNLLLLERIALAGIARVTGVSERWLQEYVNKVYAEVERTASVMPKPKGKLTVQMDELWSFVDHKGNKQWVWVAMDADTREVI
ncbi:MAG: IS1 family transposase, partial [Cyanobacteria bacterium J06638_22]